MTGNRIVVDTNPLIYLLNGNEHVATHLENKECWVSVITELELYGKKDLKPNELIAIDSLVQELYIIDIIAPIKEIVKSLVQKYTLKLPDAIVAATAIYLDLPLLSADQGFSKVPELQLLLLKPNQFPNVQMANVQI